LLLTFGTAWCYYLANELEAPVVANCHKMPAALFRRQLLSVEDIVTSYQQLLQELWNLNPRLQILFTVSPVRHRKDGLVANQRSKAILIESVHRLLEWRPEQLNYFPAFEIMIDELRDYRFYTADMLHPSDWAVDYVFKRFTSWACSPDCLTALQKIAVLQSLLSHRPLLPESQSSERSYQKATELKLELQQRYGIEPAFWDTTAQSGWQ
ncbi:MAG: GSCFA domain-containing protein, partial [Leptospiraceae bacterium]|nr:GSCFA domain-containing protein [Leptospiraceae bacterium]